MLLIEPIQIISIKSLKFHIYVLHHRYIRTDHPYPMQIQFFGDLVDVVDNEDHVNNLHHVNQVLNPFLKAKGNN